MVCPQISSLVAFPVNCPSFIFRTCLRVQDLSAVNKDTIKFVNLLPGSRLINHLIYQPIEVS